MRYRIFTPLIPLLLLLTNTIAAVCGDGICEAPYENSCTCSIDCGLCRGSAGICKEFKCVNSECVPVTIPNCCGNKICEYPENYGNCPADCKPTQVSALLISPNLGEYFVRGEKIIFKAKVTSHGRKAITADVNLTSPLFGKLKLYNDATHGDEKAYDNIYTNTFIIPKNAKPGTYDLNLDVNFMKVFAHLKYKITIDPKLTISAIVSKEIILGDYINAKISLFKKNLPIDANLTIQLYDSHNNLILKESKITQSYSLNYHTSLIERSGTWKLKLFAEDENSNLASTEYKIKIYPAEVINLLKIKILEIPKKVATDENFLIKAKVLDNENFPVSDANLFLIIPETELQFQNMSNGIYQISLDFNGKYLAGKHKWKLSAIKKISNIEITGIKEFEINFIPSQLSLEIIQPKRITFKVGETLSILLHSYYKNKDPVIGAKIKGVIANEKLNFIEIEPGFYKAALPLTQNLEGKHTITVSLEDSYKNYSQTTLSVEIVGLSPLAYIQQNLNFIVTVLLSAIILLIIFYYFFSRELNKIKLKMEKKKILSLEKELQKRYFEEGELTKKEYEKMMQEYEKRLSEIKKKLGEI